MNSDQLRETMQSLLSDLVPTNFPFERVASELTRLGNAHGMSVSPYGYVMWAVEHYGYKCAFKNLMASMNVINGYVDAAVKYRDDMPSMLLNAHQYVGTILSNVADFETCLKQLEGMTFPYVLYTLFAGSGQQDKVARYRPEMEEQMKRYPSTLDLLPESFRKVGEEVLNADAE